jgi:hypothetical protein
MLCAGYLLCARRFDASLDVAQRPIVRRRITATLNYSIQMAMSIIGVLFYYENVSDVAVDTYTASAAVQPLRTIKSCVQGRRSHQED